MTVISPSAPLRLDAEPGAAPPSARRRWPATATAIVLVAVAGVSGIRGADYPAHYLRAELVRRSGFTIWNFAWYTGHPTLPYGLLSSLLSAWVGPFVVVAISTVIATYLFSALVDEWFQPSSAAIAAQLFAATATVNVVVGRVAFGLGLALALAALVLWRRGCLVWAIVAAVATPLASPVAAVFLIVAAGTGASVRRHRRVGVVIAVAAALPVGITTLLFDGAGWFPFRAGHCLMSILVFAGLSRAVRSPAVRLASVAMIVISLALFFVPNPLGGNVVRLAQIVGVPIVIAFTLASRQGSRGFRAAALALSASAFAWSLSPGAVEVAAGRGDGSSSIAYHQPLIEAIQRLNADGRPLGRVEVPFTRNHWEAFFVAAEVPYARGWERQLDLARNAELYESDLTTDAYHAWLRGNAVRWVAVSSAPIDHAGAGEVRLVDEVMHNHDPWLQLVWSNTDWQVYEVLDAVPIVDPPVAVTRHEPGQVWLRTARSATVTLRLAYSPWLTISPSGCLSPTADGMVQVTLPKPGEYRIGASLLQLTSSRNIQGPLC